MKIRPIILSGGSGTRLWPVSRQRFPKQFAKLVGVHSLLMSTVEMLTGPQNFLPPIIIANEDHKFFVLDVLSRLKQTETRILLEPCGRNTAPAALIAALADDDKDTLHLLLPSDHVINDKASFITAITHAAKAAQQDHIALFGIEPTSPETGYGYIQRGGKTSWPQVEFIARFREKPDQIGAESLIKEGALWNSGIFLYKPSTLIAEIEKRAVDEIKLCRQALDTATTDLGCTILGKAAYTKLQNISFDYQVMEHTQRGVVVPCSMGWSDVGSWHALWQICNKDKDNNVTQGDVATLDVKNSYLRTDGPIIGAIGLDDIAVVVTKDAILIAPKARSQDVKNLVAKIEANKWSQATEPPIGMRPWGSYESVAKGDRFQVKCITVHPGQSLSLQMHHHRAEHWIVVAGTAFVECDDVKKYLHENESIYIPKGSKHRLSNQGKVDLHLVEVQSGEYLGEDDIVRFSDIYGRVAH